MNMLFSTAVSLLGLSLGSCATMTNGMPALAHGEAVSTNNFVLTKPLIYAAPVGARISGTVCRKPNRALISPAQIQIDHLRADQSLIETSHAYLAPLSRRPDQRCGHYTGKITSSVAPDDIVRVCVEHRGACSVS